MSGPLPPPVFSDAWAKACGVMINASRSYRAAAESWEGAVLLFMSPANEIETERRVFLDLWHGECRGARAGSAEDETTARYILAGDEGAWRAVLSGKVAPFPAIMTGRLKLTKGSLLDLLPYVNAARELMEAVATVPATYSGA